MKTIHLLGMASVLLAAQAHAHVSLIAPEHVAQGQSFKAVVAIPHGCEGSATTLVTLHVLVKLRRTLLSENFHTPMGSSHCWLYAAV